MDVTSRAFGNAAVVRPVGRIDQATSAALEAAVSPLWDKPDVAALILDFGGVEYISSVGLRVLMLAAKHVRARKARIAVAGLQPVVAEIFAISRFNAVLEVFPSLRDAVATLAPDALPAYESA